MTRVITVSVFVATMLAASLTSMSLASPSGDNGRLRFEVIAPSCGSPDTECNDWDLPPTGPPGPADGFTFSTPLFDGEGTVVGHNDGVCTVVVADPITDHCVNTHTFDGGTITTQGLFHEGNEPSDTLAITGGTGAFRNAGGEAELTFQEDGLHFVFHVTG
jgi:hypothetical protein